MRARTGFFWIAGLSLSMSLVLGCKTPHALSGDHHGHEALSVVPDQEKEIALHKGLDGPRKTQGIAGVETLVGLELGSEFEGLSGQQMRARALVIAPGGVVAVHQHEQRPGFAYILEGEIVEYRNDTEGPIIRKAGDVAVERTGVSHWWENKSGKEVRALVVDIVPIEK